MHATLSQIAQEAGVSVALVSRLLRSDKTLRVGQETRRKVLQAERRLGGARVRSRAASIPAKPMSIIAPISRVYEMSSVHRLLADSISGAFLRSFEQRLAADQCRLGFTFFDNQRKSEEFAQIMQSPGFCDGLLLLSGMVDAAVADLLLRNKYPHVAMGDHGERFPINSVSAHAAGGLRQAVAHLHDLGHHRIAYAGSIRKGATRFGLFLAAMAAEGLSVQDEGHCGLSTQAANMSTEQWLTVIHAEIAQWFNRRPDATAVVCSNDTVALAVIDVARKRGLHVGRDLSVVGYDNAEVHGPHQTSHPILTTVDNPVEQIGLRCANLLIAQMKDRNMGTVHEQIPTQLIVRGTTGRVPG